MTQPLMTADTQTLIANLKSLLVEKGLKIAVAESITCGNLQAAFGSISGASAFFEGGMTVYSSQQKSRLLNIDPQHAASVNSVSAQVASELAKGICEKFQVNIGIGTTGYAEPNTEQQIAEPIAYIALWHNQSEVAKQTIDGKNLNRQQMQDKVVKTALQALLNYLQTLPKHL